MPASTSPSLHRAGLVHLPALGLQRAAHEAPDLRLVFDDHDGGGGFAHARGCSEHMLALVSLGIAGGVAERQREA